MDYRQITKQMIQLNKTAFDNSFTAMTLVYEQNEKIADTFLSQASWMPEEGKTVIKDWLAAYRTGCADFKKLVDDNYAKVAAYFDQQV